MDKENIQNKGIVTNGINGNQHNSSQQNVQPVQNITPQNGNQNPIQTNSNQLNSNLQHNQTPVQTNIPSPNLNQPNPQPQYGNQHNSSQQNVQPVQNITSKNGNQIPMQTNSNQINGNLQANQTHVNQTPVQTNIPSPNLNQPNTQPQYPKKGFAEDCNRELNECGQSLECRNKNGRDQCTCGGNGDLCCQAFCDQNLDCFQGLQKQACQNRDMVVRQGGACSKDDPAKECALGLYCKQGAKDRESSVVGGVLANAVAGNDQTGGFCRCGDEDKPCCSHKDRIIQRRNKGIPDDVTEQCNGNDLVCSQEGLTKDSVGKCVKVKPTQNNSKI